MDQQSAETRKNRAVAVAVSALIVAGLLLSLGMQDGAAAPNRSRAGGDVVDRAVAERHSLLVPPERTKIDGQPAVPGGADGLAGAAARDGESGDVAQSVLVQILYGQSVSAEQILRDDSLTAGAELGPRCATVVESFCVEYEVFRSKLLAIADLQEQEVRLLAAKGLTSNAAVVQYELTQEELDEYRKRFPQSITGSSDVLQKSSVIIPTVVDAAGRSRAADAWVHDSKNGVVYGACYGQLPQTSGQLVELSLQLEEFAYRLMGAVASSANLPPDKLSVLVDLVARTAEGRRKIFRG